MIEVRNLSRSFGDVRAVRDISFSVTPGRIHGILGPNGAGKSTTIRMILGILDPDSGSIDLQGMSPTEFRRRVGYLPEEKGLYKKETVENMLLYLGRLKGADDEALRTSLGTWLDRFGLADWRKKKIETLSKGMSQKVQFISCILHDPELLILDEPFSGLDPVSVDELREVILELSSRGKTILFSTHVMEQAERICQDILLLSGGQALLSGPLGDIKSRYGSRTVHLEFDGDGTFLKDLDMVDSVRLQNRHCEARLRESGSADDFLQAAAGKLSISRFETSEPSLHAIFIDAVEGENNEGK